MDELIEGRKADHLRLSAAGGVDALGGAGWDDVKLVHEALPELDEGDVDLSVTFLGRRLRATKPDCHRPSTHPAVTLCP